jgi:hypothetical protein
MVLANVWCTASAIISKKLRPINGCYVMLADENCENDIRLQKQLNNGASKARHRGLQQRRYHQSVAATAAMHPSLPPQLGLQLLAGTS